MKDDKDFEYKGTNEEMDKLSSTEGDEYIDTLLEEIFKGEEGEEK